MFECKKWEKIILNLSEIEFDIKKNPIMEMLKYLKSQRNTLPSRRIFRVATINERIKNRINISNNLKTCTDWWNKISQNAIIIKEMSEIIEIIIYAYSNLQNDYKKYSELVITNIKNICKYMDYDSTFIPKITEFIIKEGDTDLINIERIDKIIFKNSQDSKYYENLNEYLSKIRDYELKCYKAALIIQQNYKPASWRKKILRLINKQIKINNEKSKDFLYKVAQNTYIPPTITNMIPKIEIQNTYFTPIYWIIDKDKYLYGGNFPSFKSTIDGTDNYTDDDLYDLAITLNLEYDKDIDIKDLYDKCMLKLENCFSDNKKQIYPETSIIKFNPTIIKQPKYISFVNYIYRPTIGVKDPGQVYQVYLDNNSTQYIVPFKFSINGIPIYNKKFLNDEINKFFYYEGPAIFEESDDPNHYIYSSYYILIEYRSEFGKIRYFREGVNSKFIKKTPIEKFDACNRFTNEIDCNDLHSYGLNKKKCIFIEGKCQSQHLQIDINQFKSDLDIDKYVFYKTDAKGNKKIDLYKQKKLKDAIQSAVIYINKLILIKKLNENEIKEQFNIQKIKLIQFIDNLNKFNPQKDKLLTIIEDVEFTNKKIDLVSQFPTILNLESVNLKSTDLDINLQTTIIQLPIVVEKHLPISSNLKLVIGVKYLVNAMKTYNKVDNQILKLINEYERDKINYVEFEGGNLFERSKISIKTQLKSQIVEKINFTISDEDFNFLNNPPDLFEFNLINKNYSILNNDIKVETNIKQVKNLPYEIIFLEYEKYILKYPEYVLQNKNHINNEILYNSFAEILYSTFSKDNNDFLVSFDIFNATTEAKKLALIYNIDLKKLKYKISGEIQKQHVLDEYNKILPNITSIKDSLINKLQYFIINNDKKGLINIIKKAEKYYKQNLDVRIKELIDQAKDKLSEIEKSKLEPIQEPIQEPIKEPIQEPIQKSQQPALMSYMINRRKKK